MIQIEKNFASAIIGYGTTCVTEAVIAGRSSIVLSREIPTRKIKRIADMEDPIIISFSDASAIRQFIQSLENIEKTCVNNDKLL